MEPITDRFLLFCSEFALSTALPHRFPTPSSSGWCPRPRWHLIKQLLTWRQLLVVCEAGMGTQNVPSVSAGEEGWENSLSVPQCSPHGRARALKPTGKAQIQGSHCPIPLLPFPPPHSGSQQRMKPETGANGIRGSPRPIPAAAGMQRLCHGLILAPLCSENNPKAAGKERCWRPGPAGAFPFKGLTGLVQASSSSSCSGVRADPLRWRLEPGKVLAGVHGEFSPAHWDFLGAIHTRMAQPLPLLLSPISHHLLLVSRQGEGAGKALQDGGCLCSPPWELPHSCSCVSLPAIRAPGLTCQALSLLGPMLGIVCS